MHFERWRCCSQPESRAYSLYANDQAARHFGAALGLIREGRRTELLPFVLERLGEAWERVGGDRCSHCRVERGEYLV